MDSNHINKVFISHSSSDYRDSKKQIIPGNVISEIINTLEANHIDKWIDEQGLLSGKCWTSQIREAIDNCNIFLFVASENSNKSINTANEIGYAQSQHKHLIVFRVDESPICNDILLNIINIHELHYFKDRKKALTDLVASIKKIKTDAVVSYTSASINQNIQEVPVNGEFFSTRVLSIFNSQNMEVSSNTFIYFYDLMCNSEKGRKTLKNHLDKLANLSSERNPDVRRTRIINLIALMKDETAETERHVSLLSILLKMYLYFLISDIKEVYEIQKEIDRVDFLTTFFEDNSEVINDVTDGVVRIGGLVASTIAVIMGRGGNLARSTMFATSHSGKVNLVKTSQEITFLKKSFHALKTAMLNLHF